MDIGVMLFHWAIDEWCAVVLPSFSPANL